MSTIDIVILILTILLVISIVFFSFVLPKIEGKRISCSSCPATKSGKRLLKAYKKENKN